MMTFFLAMLLHPDIARKAQQELDVVTGRDRLPTFEDRPRLPFVDAVCKEVLRWQPIAPLGTPTSERPGETSESLSTSTIGFPHAVTEDDVYNGFFIPKGLYYFPSHRNHLIDLSFTRRHCSSKYMVSCLSRTLEIQLQLFQGKSCMTLPHIQSQKPSNRNDSSIQMGPCATMRR